MGKKSKKKPVKFDSNFTVIEGKDFKLVKLNKKELAKELVNIINSNTYV